MAMAIKLIYQCVSCQELRQSAYRWLRVIDLINVYQCLRHRFKKLGGMYGRTHQCKRLALELIDVSPITCYADQHLVLLDVDRESALEVIILLVIDREARIVVNGDYAADVDE